MSEMNHAETGLAGSSKNAGRVPFSSPSAVAFSVVLASLLVAGWTIGRAEAAEKPAPAKPAAKAADEAAKATAATKAEKPKKPAKKKDPFAWKSMFDGKTLKGWKVPVFGGDGEVTVKDGAITLAMGDPMTGVTFAGKLPTENYEVTFEAKRIQGIDFFATTTFPVGKDPDGKEQHCSFVTGGWAGTVVGISCVDFYDASDNLTTQFMAFDDNKWYKFRIRVSEPKIECWIGDENMVDLPREKHKFDVRIEVDLCKPFGFSSYMTEGAVRKVRVRRLKPEEVAAIKKEMEKERSF
jgi:hypothetical protein